MTEERKRLIVKPSKPDLIVRHPRTMQPIASAGEDVTHYRGYFNRMLRTGDVVPATLPAVPVRKRKGE